MYVRFGQSSGCLYIRDGGESFSETWLYFKMISVTVVNNRYIGIVGNISFKCPSIQYSSQKFC